MKNNTVEDFLYRITVRNLNQKAKDWLDSKLELLSQNFNEREFYLAFSAASRFAGKSRLSLSEIDRQEANTLRKGFYPLDWTTDQACRVILILKVPHIDKAAYLKILDKVYETADVSELVALYSTLPLLPHPTAHQSRAAEGIRSNMTVVFDAVALDNPYPRDYFIEGAWNQMVLKAIFMERPLYRIQGIDDRCNSNLARMLSDFAHERWAAHRPTSPELWRPIGPFLDTTILHDLQKLFDHKEVIQREAAALACERATSPEARELLSRCPELKEKIDRGMLNWELIAKKWYRDKPA